MINDRVPAQISVCTKTNAPIRSMKLLKDWLLRLLSVTFIAKAKSAKSEKCCQRSTSDWFSGCTKNTKSDNSRSIPRYTCVKVRQKKQSTLSDLAAAAVTVCVTPRCESRGGHVGASYCLDLCDAAEFVPVQ